VILALGGKIPAIGLPTEQQLMQKIMDNDFSFMEQLVEAASTYHLTHLIGDLSHDAYFISPFMRERIDRIEKSRDETFSVILEGKPYSLMQGSLTVNVNVGLYCAEAKPEMDLYCTFSGHRPIMRLGMRGLGALIRILEAGFDGATSAHIEGDGGLAVSHIMACKVEYVVISRVVEGAAPSTYMKVLLCRRAFARLARYVVDESWDLRGYVVTADALKVLDWDVTHKVVEARRQACIACLSHDNQALILRGVPPRPRREKIRFLMGTHTCFRDNEAILKLAGDAVLEFMSKHKRLLIRDLDPFKIASAVHYKARKTMRSLVHGYLTGVSRLIRK
jgi:hypothetical protein